MSASIHAGDVTSNSKIVSRNTETLLDSSKEVCMEVNTWYIFMYLYQRVGRNQKWTGYILHKIAYGNHGMGSISLCFMSLVDYLKIKSYCSLMTLFIDFCWLVIGKL
jgi:hypothetical protein